MGRARLAEGENPSVRGSGWGYNPDMEWLDNIVHGFIMTFGITQPSPEKKRVANLFIGGLLLLIVIAFLGMIVFGIRHLIR